MRAIPFFYFPIDKTLLLMYNIRIQLKEYTYYENK